MRRGLGKGVAGCWVFRGRAGADWMGREIGRWKMGFIEVGKVVAWSVKGGRSGHIAWIGAAALGDGFI
jgi:hypothetical protein